MSLANKCICTIRKELSRCSATGYADYWSKADTVKGGDEFIVFEDGLRRDIVAYIIVRYFFIFDAYIFGGFVASHHSGLPWNDIDIMLVRPHDNFIELLNNLPSFICMMTGLAKDAMSIKQSSQSAYGNKVELKVKYDEQFISIPIDLCFEWRLALIPWPPITVGSCLKMDKDGTSWRHIREPYPFSPLEQWCLSDIIALLKVGQDFRLEIEYPPGELAYKKYLSSLAEKSKLWKLIGPTQN